VHVFHDIGKGILDSAWRGYNATLLAYGQTGSGKSYSMIGCGTNKGIIPRVCEELFQAIKTQKKSIESQVMFSMLEIYNEQIRDLLSRTKTPGGLKVREDQQLGFFVEGLKWVPCENYAQIEKLMEQGSKIRMTASTNMNASSSRSHMVITIQFKQIFLDTAFTKQSSINMVDLAGNKHASFTNLDGKVTIAPHSKSKVVVNGVPVTNRTKLQHLDRVILGSNSAFLYIGFPSERGGEDLSRFDYDFFQLERAAAEGVSVDMLGTVSPGDGQAEPSVLAVFQDYIKLMPLVVEANQMSEELEKGLKMELKVKNLASSDSRGYDLQKEVIVKVTKPRTHERFLESEDSQVAQEDDPFWDPVEVVHLGSAHIWLQSLAYCMMLEEQVEFLNCDGLQEAVLHIRITPCSPEGWAHGEEDMVTDPLELLGKRIDFQIHIVGCLGVKWLKEDATRGIQMGYKIYDLPNTLYTKPVWKSVNPRIEETVHIVALNASHEFLDYLLTNALIVDLWGLQEGCAEFSFSRPDTLLPGEGHIMVDTKKSSSVKNVNQLMSNQVPEIYQTLLKLEQETELLRDVNRALREENVFLKASLEKTGSAQQDNPESAGVMAQLPTAREAKQMCVQQASCDAQLARALKVFYQGMSMARGQLFRLRQCRPPEDDQMLRPFVHQQSLMLKDLEDLLESSLQKLKNDVAVIVKKKKEYLLHIQQRR
ncbi:hypothetical protein A6R68_04349, partial [Neotoma lepida]